MKIYSSFILIALFISNSNCNATKTNESITKDKNKYAVSIKNGYFYPQECILRKIFSQTGSGGGYWLEGAFRWQFWKTLNLEASGSYFRRSGKSLGSNACTEIKLPTIGLGLKYFFDTIPFYIGGGLRLFFYSERNSSCYVIHCLKKTAPGGMISFGFECNPYKELFLGLSMEYNKAKFKPNCGITVEDETCVSCCPSKIHSIDIGGFVTSIELSLRF